MTYRRSPASGDPLATGLALFSIGLGLYELLAPRHLARTLGMRRQEGLIQAYGAREIATGIAILASRDPTPWLWGRVAGDALDLVTLAGGLDESNRRREHVGLAMAAVAGVAILDVAAAQRAGGRQGRPALPRRNYSDRSGLPRGVEATRAAARRNFETPPDFREPTAMRPPKWEQPRLH
jgi:Domain of unknown function (DUF4267)